ncbi:MAG TPA: pitrilysin family protein [Planctomycetota bacterium]|nr:pitrilysin family protein [Planctomycetota bacterium]
MSARLAVRAASLVAAALLAAAPLLAQADRSHPPKPGAVKPLKLPHVERLKLSNGIGVVLVGMHEVPVAEVILVLRAGAVADPAGREGLAAMTADMLDEGAGGKDALALADAIDFLGATVGAGSAWDVSTVRLRVPVARLDDALSLMADVALRPDFPEAELQRLRKEALTDLLQARDEPGAIAARALAQAVFGPAHRYGKPQAGGAEQIAAFTVADLRAFHAARYVPSAATLVVVGDVSASVLPSLEKAFGSWKAASAAAPVPALPEPRQLTSRSIWLVDKKEAAQSSLRLGRVGPAWPDPAYAANQVMNTLLGGSFTSRLNDNLREQHGYAYGARSGFRRNLTGGLFQVATDVQTDKSGPAVGEVFKELERILTPAAADEVERARNYAALGYAGDFETTGQLAQRMVDAVVYGLPDGFYEGFVPKALAVDAAALQQAARGAIDTRKIALVVVGDRAKVEAPLRALNLGAIRNLTVDDVMGKPPAIE